MSDADDSEIEGFLSGHKPFEKPPICPCGTCVGDWKILAFLGRGGSSEVYRAENKVTGQVAALKVLARTDGKTRERFKREVRLVAETQNAAFPKFYGAGEENGRLYIAEELLEPVVLPSRDAEVARFILDVAAGVAELHRLGFIHRDIKPSNIMVEENANVRLMDLGIARMSGGNKFSQSGFIGTPQYAAPEQITRDGNNAIPINAATDIYSLGVTFYELLTGINPFDSDSEMETLTRQMRDPLPKNDLISKRLMQVLLKATEKEQSKRYQTAAEFQAAIVAAMALPPTFWQRIKNMFSKKS